MTVFFLVLLFGAAGDKPTTIPMYYETKTACVEAAKEVQKTSVANYVCVPWNREGD